MTTLAIILTQGFADWECGHLMATAQYMGCETIVATPGGKNVTSSGGLEVIPGKALEALEPEGADALVICGGAIWQSGEAPDIGPLVRRFREAGVLVGGICDGVLALARTGVLNGHEHTGNDLETLKSAPGYAGEALYKDVPQAVRADGLVTAAGTAPVTFMAEVLAGLGFGGDELDFYLGLLAAEHGPRLQPS